MKASSLAIAGVCLLPRSISDSSKPISIIPARPAMLANIFSSIGIIVAELNIRPLKSLLAIAMRAANEKLALIAFLIRLLNSRCALFSRGSN